MSYPIEFRDAQRDAFCRGCDGTIKKGQPMVATFSWRNRGQNIYFCVGCAGVIGSLVKNCLTAETEMARLREEIGVLKYKLWDCKEKSKPMQGQ